MRTNSLLQRMECSLLLRKDDPNMKQLYAFGSPLAEGPLLASMTAYGMWW